jgi:hypothetical protein
MSTYFKKGDPDPKGIIIPSLIKKKDCKGMILSEFLATPSVMFVD